MKAQLNNSTNLPNNRDQQTKLSSMLNWRSFKEHRPPLAPLEDGAKGDAEASSENPTKPPNGLPNNQKNLLRPNKNLTINNNSLNGNLNSVVPKNAGYQNKHLLTEASNAISAISTMRNGIILTSGHPKVVDFNVIAKNNGHQPAFNESAPQVNSALPQPAPKASQSSSQTKTIIQVSWLF